MRLVFTAFTLAVLGGCAASVPPTQEQGPAASAPAAGALPTAEADAAAAPAPQSAPKNK